MILVEDDTKIWNTAEEAIQREFGHVPVQGINGCVLKYIDFIPNAEVSTVLLALKKVTAAIETAFFTHESVDNPSAGVAILTRVFDFLSFVGKNVLGAYTSSGSLVHAGNKVYILHLTRWSVSTKKSSFLSPRQRGNEYHLYSVVVVEK